MKIHFHGAAGGVTGSKHIIEANGQKVLLDCGLFQGRRKESFLKNQKFQFDASELDAVVLSHAHIDHSGALPTLVKNGFTGKIYCTPATADITKVMLLDSAHIQEMDAEYYGRKLNKTAVQPIEPIYTIKDAENVAQYFQAIPLHTKFQITKDITGQLFDAGHVLGSEIVELTILDQGRKRKLVFTGDLGRKNRSILRDPEFIYDAEILLTESTYGGRFHPDPYSNRNELRRVVREASAKGGKLIVPSFSLERTQEIIFDLNLMRKNNQIPDIDIVIDSPLSTKVTELFKKHIECFDHEAKREFLSKGKNPFDKVTFTQSVEESKALNMRRGPFIIISASGMCEAGRIRHHLRNNITDPKNTIMIVGYQAEHTLGRRIVEGREFIKIFDEMLPVRAKVEVLNGFSGHADRNDLLEFAEHINNLKKVFVVHGDPDQSLALADGIKDMNSELDVVIPKEGDVIKV